MDYDNGDKITNSKIRQYLEKSFGKSFENSLDCNFDFNRDRCSSCATEADVMVRATGVGFMVFRASF